MKSHYNLWFTCLFICFIIRFDDTKAIEPIINCDALLENKNAEGSLNTTDFTFRILSVPENTYGYEILIKNKVLIRQLNIPGQPGVKGFKTKTDAEKVAQLVIKKLSQGIMPPTIEKNELIELKIIF